MQLTLRADYVIAGTPRYSISEFHYVHRVQLATDMSPKICRECKFFFPCKLLIISIRFVILRIIRSLFVLQALVLAYYRSCIRTANLLWYQRTIDKLD